MADDPTVTDPDTDPVVEDDPTTEPEPEPTESDEYTPPTREELDALKAEHARLLAEAKAATDKTAAALKKANAESATRRRELAELEKQHADDETRAKLEARDAALAELKPVAIRAEAKAQLLGVKAKPDRLEALMDLLNLNAIDVDGDRVTGLDTEVDRLQERFPEFFTTDPEPAPTPEPTPRPAAPRIDTTGRRPAPVDKPKSFGEIVAAAVHGAKK